MGWIAALLLISSSILYSDAQVRIQLGRQEVPLDPIESGPRASIKLAPQPLLLKNYKNVYYYGKIIIGTPGDKLDVIFDTGSPSMWVYSGTGWRSWLCIPCWFHRRYHHGKSSTYIPDGRYTEMYYVDSYMKGYVSQDILSIGNVSARVYFTEAVKTPILQSILDKYDGILGLSPCSGLECDIYKKLTPSVVSPILSQLPKSVFSIYLNRLEGRFRNEKKSSEIIFGGTDSLRYREETLSWHPTLTPYMWSIRLESIWVGDHLVLNYTKGGAAFLDTGTSYIVGPPADTIKLLSELGIDQSMLECETYRKLPPIIFVMGGKKYTLNSTQYALESAVKEWGEKYCYHGIGASEIGTNTWILGDVFLSTVYSIFEVGDHSSSKIGLAQLK